MDEGKPPKKTTSDKISSSKEASIQVNMPNARVRDVLIGPGSSVSHGISQQESTRLLDMLAEPSRTYADLLLITATDSETAAIIKQFPAFEDLFIHKSTYYDFGTIAGAHVCLVQSEKGSVSMGGSLQTAAQGINALSPAAVIMVGIAFGIGRAGQNIGDILVGQQIMAYEAQKVSQVAEGETRIIPRGDRASASPWLLNRCHHGYADWSGADVHFGLLLSGDKLIDN